LNTFAQGEILMRHSQKLRAVRFRPFVFLALLSCTLSLVFACSFPFSGAAQHQLYDPSLRYADTTGLGVGTNLSGIADWSSQMPFIDGFKSARRWITRCPAEGACSNAWETGEYEQLDLDEQGWVKSLPAPEDPPEYSRVATLIHHGLERYPGGQYVVLYDGEGQIDYDFDARKDPASRPGRDLINVTPSKSGIQLIVSSTDPNKTGNYIRNIRVVPIEYEQTYKTEIFNPLFLERIKQFGTLRFMDWMGTNHSEQGEWRDRPQVEDATYALKGVPIEIMVELCNRLRAHPWFNMPHKATDDYMTNFAQLVKQRLDPNLKVYVEFSNEVWNWMFSQANYALQQGKQRWGEDKGDAYMQWYGMRTAQMSEIWKRVFGNRSRQVISVISSQTAWKGLETSALDCPLWVAEGNKPCYQHGIDVYTITGYYSGSLGDDANRSTVESWAKAGETGIKQALAQLEQGGKLEGQDSVPDTIDFFVYHQQVAQKHNLRLTVYEGGQSIANANNDQLTPFFTQVNRRPEMYGIYQKVLEAWKSSGGTLFMNFTDISPPMKWGYWGVLEHVDQPHSPRYDALMDFIRQNRLR
jgi:hypothetical protein